MNIVKNCNRSSLDAAWVITEMVIARQSAGYFGKLPSRGDFVGIGLPISVVKNWDQAFASTLAVSKMFLENRWVDIWIGAPVWRFALPMLICDRQALLGLWMPSVDKVGRYFPLMIAATCPNSTPEQMARHGTAWLDAAEDAGRAAIADDLSPEQLKARIPPPPDFASTPDTGLPYNLQPRPGAGLWWSEGSPRVPAQGLVLDTLPDAATFVAMLDAGSRTP